MKAIHQFLAGFSGNDAISNEARVMRSIFRSWGYESEIYSENKRILPELRKESRDVGDYRGSSDDLVLLHLSIGSIVNDAFAQAKCRKAILYHNITPPEMLAGMQQQIAHNLAWGREQIKHLPGVASVVMADSSFNAHELEELGYGKVHVLPLILELDRLRGRPDRWTYRKFNDGKTNIIFVGRCVPNKRIEDLLVAFYYFQKFVEPNSRFIHVGSFAGTEKYYTLLLAISRDLELNDVCLVGSYRQEELNAVYKAAHVFLCMSEHEGFCIPLIEGMVHDVPVLAYAAGAVPETMSGAGVLFREKNYPLIAEMMGAMVRDRQMRASLIQQQQKRIALYEQRNLEAELRQHLQPLL